MSAAANPFLAPLATDVATAPAEVRPPTTLLRELFVRIPAVVCGLLVFCLSGWMFVFIGAMGETWHAIAGCVLALAVPMLVAGMVARFLRQVLKLFPAPVAGSRRFR